MDVDITLRTGGEHPGGQFAALVASKAWEHLGMTQQEFLRSWYSGAFRGDVRPAAVALDRLMRTGTWIPPGR